MPKTTDVPGHAWNGWEYRYPSFTVPDGTCECRAKFSAKTKIRMRAMHRDHLKEVLAKRQMIKDFQLVIAWARVDQSQAAALAENKLEVREAAENFALIDRVEKALHPLLEREAR